MGTPRLPARYTLLGSIGQGGEGHVFRVQDGLRRAELALKVAPPRLSHWLRLEFETLRQIQHENLIRVFDWGLTDEGEVFYTMELVVGNDWGKRMGTPQSHEDVARILTAVLKGLAHLHSHGEIHQDLKPGNVLLGDGSVKLADVGMSASADGTSLSGTPGYSAPELWHGAQPSPRSDIYSIGVMAYEALTGQHPFMGRTIREVVSGQLEGWVPSLASRGARLPAELERSVLRSLERDPNLRPGTADELLELLGERDRIGAILGGKFVARRDELQTVSALLESQDPTSPVLAWIGGESGVGKSALIEEVAGRATTLGYQVVQVVDVSDVGAFRSPLAPTFTESEQVWSLAQQQPTVFVADISEDDLGATAVAMRALARHLQAIAMERGRSAQVLLLAESHGSITATETFELALKLAPMTEIETGDFLKGFLGAVDIRPEVIGWLSSVAGGLPGRLSTVIGELIDRNVLRRHAGRWQFKEDQDLPSIEGSLSRGKWGQFWDRLNQEEKAVVALLAIMPQGISRDALQEVADRTGYRVEGLLKKGWLRASGAKLQLASGEARRAAIAFSAGLGSAIEGALIEVGHESISREELAWLMLRNRPSIEALKEGLWAAGAARDRGDLRTTVERARACLSLSETLKDQERAEEAEFVLAQALHLLGHNDQAVQHLTRTDRRPNAGRELLLGVIRRSQGRLNDARLHLKNAIALAQETGDGVVFFRSHAELAEVDWRHGDERSREAAIGRITDALRQQAGVNANAIDRAALAYHLGSALIVSGRRDEAKRILEEALLTTSDDYWVMRLRNALASAQYYLGEFEAALDNLGEAWSRAERGGFDLFKARIFANRASIHYGLGRFKDAVDYHRLAATWARRNGQEFEYVVACTDEAVNLMYLGLFESALLRAKEAEGLARQIGNEYQLMRNLETGVLCNLLIGDVASAEEFLEQLLQRSELFGRSAIAPRALLLEGMFAEATGNWELARKKLTEAEEILLKERDWEDLPAVQIELQWVRAQQEAGPAASELGRILGDVVRSGALTVQLRGALILAEVLLRGGIDDREYRQHLYAALGKAGESGASDDEWKLNAVLGELCFRGGDAKSGITRCGQAVRGFRVILDLLSPQHRQSYIRTTHATRLLSRVSEPT